MVVLANLLFGGTSCADKTQTSKPEELPDSLHRAVESGSYQDLLNLLKQGINVNAKSTEGETPLFQAVELYASFSELNVKLPAEQREARRAIVFALIKAGADPNIVSREGRTPLFWAARCGDEEIIQELLDGGAYVLQIDIFGDTAYDYAVNHPSVARHLEEVIYSESPERIKSRLHLGR